MKFFMYMSEIDKLEWFPHEKGNGWKKTLLKKLVNFEVCHLT